MTSHAFENALFDLMDEALLLLDPCGDPPTPSLHPPPLSAPAEAPPPARSEWGPTTKEKANNSKQFGMGRKL